MAAMKTLLRDSTGSELKLAARTLGGVLLAAASIGNAAELFQLGKSPALASDEFGFATVADAQFVIAGAPGENAEAGAVYIFNCGTPSCPQEARLAASDLLTGHAYGSTLALSGNTLAVGAPGQGAGAVYVYVRTAPGVWLQQTKLINSGGTNGERFGSALALLGNTLLVGLDGDNSKRGSVYAYNRAGVSWALPTMLLAPDGVSGDGFGAAVALSASHALIGAPYEGNTGPGQISARGAAYAFERTSATAWSAPVKLLSATPASGDLFGFAVALQGDRAVVGAPFALAGDGRVAVFEFITGVGWSASAEFASDNTNTGAHLGWSLALDGDQLSVGAPFDAVDPGINCGITARYTRTASVWNETYPLQLRGAAPGNFAGWSAALVGTRHALGMPGTTKNAAQHAGSIAWFDPTELMFTDAYEVPHPDCANPP
jgi:FG-GAP repeat